MTRPVCPGQWPSRPLRERAVARATVACAAQAHRGPLPHPFVGPARGCLALAADNTHEYLSAGSRPLSPRWAPVETLSVRWVLGASAGVTGWGLPCRPLPRAPLPGLGPPQGCAPWMAPHRRWARPSGPGSGAPCGPHPRVTQVGDWGPGEEGPHRSGPCACHRVSMKWEP